MFKFIFNNLGIIFGLLALTSLVVYGATWSEPTAVAPDNNTEAPINVGGSAQLKGGGLSVLSRLLVGLNGIGDLGVNLPLGEAPTQAVDADGYVKGRTGLCIGNDCRTSWPSGGSGSFGGVYSYFCGNSSNCSSGCNQEWPNAMAGNTYSCSSGYDPKLLCIRDNDGGGATDSHYIIYCVK